MRKRVPLTQYFRTIHPQNAPRRADCRGCTQPTCSDPDNPRSAYQACYGWMYGLVDRLNASDPSAEAKVTRSKEYPSRYAVTALRNGECESE